MPSVYSFVYGVLLPGPGVHHVCVHILYVTACLRITSRVCTSSYNVRYSLTQDYIACIYIVLCCVLQLDPGVHHMCVYHHIRVYHVCVHHHLCVLQPDPGVHHMCVHHHIFCYSLTQEYITCVYIIYCVLQPDPGIHHVCVQHHILCVTA